MTNTSLELIHQWVKSGMIQGPLSELIFEEKLKDYETMRAAVEAGNSNSAAQIAGRIQMLDDLLPTINAYADLWKVDRSG